MSRLKTWVCTKCKVKKPLNILYFAVDRRIARGLAPRCRVCSAAYDVVYRKRVYRRVKPALPKEVKCTLCKKVKPIVAFAQAQHYSLGYDTRCRACMRAKALARSRYWQTKTKKIPEMRVCSCCKVTRLGIDFFKRSGTPGGMRSVCKHCEYKLSQARYQKNREHILLRKKLYYLSPAVRTRRLLYEHNRALLVPRRAIIKAFNRERWARRRELV